MQDFAECYRPGLTPDFRYPWVAGNSHVYLFHFPEVGIQIDEILDSKSTIIYRGINNSYHSGRVLHDITFCQSHYPSKDRTILACYTRSELDDRDREALEISYQLHF